MRTGISVALHVDIINVAELYRRSSHVGIKNRDSTSRTVNSGSFVTGCKSERYVWSYDSPIVVSHVRDNARSFERRHV